MALHALAAHHDARGPDSAWGTEKCSQRPSGRKTPALSSRGNQNYPQCIELVKQATGAAFVAAFDHNVRSATGKQAGRQTEEEGVLVV